MAGRSCRVVRAPDVYQGKQGLPVFAGVSAETTGAEGLCLHLVTIPAGGRAKAHLHEHHESAIYLVTGQVDTWWGEGLAGHALLSAGDFLYIPAGVPHLPVNHSMSGPATAVVARTDPNEQESVMLLPELDELPHLTGSETA